VRSQLKAHQTQGDKSCARSKSDYEAWVKSQSCSDSLQKDSLGQCPDPAIALCNKKSAQISYVGSKLQSLGMAEHKILMVSRRSPNTLQRRPDHLPQAAGPLIGRSQRSKWQEGGSPPLSS
jgi:hypothetical protein